MELSKINISNIKQNAKAQVLILSVIGLLLFIFLVENRESLFLVVAKELIVVFIIYSIISNYTNLFGKKNFKPIKLVISFLVANLFILANAHIFELIVRYVFGFNEEELYKSGSPFLKGAIFTFNFTLMIVTAYFFIVFKEFLFYKQRRNLKTYYIALVLFVFLAGLTALLNEHKDYKFINLAITVNAIILIVINSLKISWIAFLSQKEKKQLLMLSILICALFIVNLNYNVADDFITSMTGSFSPALHHLLFIFYVYGIIYFSILFLTVLFHLPTAAEFDRKANEVSSLQFFSKMINEVRDDSELAETITELALKVCDGSAAWMTRSSNSADQPIAPQKIGFFYAEKISRHVFTNGLARGNTKIEYFDLRPYTKTQTSEEKYSYVAVAKLSSHRNDAGYLFIVKKDDAPFDDEDRSALETFSEYTAIALENSSLLKESIEKERLEKELDVAREIQYKLIPQKIPTIEKFDVAAMYIPAFEVGGDYYDFFEFENGNIGFTIADVSGKGITAAFIMAEIRGIIESYSKILSSPKEIMDKVNVTLKRTLDKKSFVTAAYGMINLSSGKLKMVRAGHCPILTIRKNNIEILKPRGIGLGLSYNGFFKESLEEIELNLEKDDILILFTDGILEAKNEHLEDFGLDSVQEIVRQNSHLSSEEIANIIFKEVMLFSENCVQHDDMTLMVFKRKN